MSPSAWDTFGPYRLLRVVASDAVSTTYFALKQERPSKARHESAQLAVHIAGPMDDTGLYSVDLAERYLAEVEGVSVVDHPAVVRPTDMGMIDGHPYVVTPFIRAVPLRELLAHRRSLSTPAVAPIFADLADGLDAAHDVGIVHGAIGPHTIWVGPRKSTTPTYAGYLAGFGSALLLRAYLASNPHSGPIDDVLYIAPEQLSGDPLGPASDQYSLSCALYHALAAEPPFTCDTRSELYWAHVQAPLPDPRISVPEVSTSTASAVSRGMAKDPTERFSTCGALVDAAFGHELRVTPKIPPDAFPPRNVPDASAPRRRRPPSSGVRSSRLLTTLRRTRTGMRLAVAGAAAALVGLALWLLAADSESPSANQSQPLSTLTQHAAMAAPPASSRQLGP